MAPDFKRNLFPLAGPCYQTLAWWPVHLLALTVDAYHRVFFAVLDGRRP